MFETFLTILAGLVFLFSTLLLLAVGREHPSKIDGGKALNLLLVWAISGAWLVTAVIS
jgi:hypothetical protein